MPAVSLPLHWTPAGLPVGVMLAARPAEEGLLLSLAAQVEAALRRGPTAIHPAGESTAQTSKVPPERQ